MTINGRVAAGSETFDVENPATGAAFAQASDCTQQELDARAALPAGGAVLGFRGAML